MGGDLPRKCLLEPVVVANCGQSRRLRVQGNRGQRTSFIAITSDDLRCEMLRLSRTSAISGGEQSGAPGQPLGEEAAPPLDQVDLRDEPGQRVGQCSDVCTPCAGFAYLCHPATFSVCRSARPMPS